MAKISEVRIRPTPGERLPGRLTCRVAIGDDQFASKITLRSYDAAARKSVNVGALIVSHLLIQDAPCGLTAKGTFIVDLGGCWLDQTLTADILAPVRTLKEWTANPSAYAMRDTYGDDAPPRQVGGSTLSKPDEDTPF